MMTLVVCTRTKLSDEFRRQAELALRGAINATDPQADVKEVIFADKDDLEDILDPGHAPLPPFDPVQDKMAVRVMLEQAGIELKNKSAEMVSKIFNRLAETRIVTRERTMVVVTGIDYSRGHYYYGQDQP